MWELLRKKGKIVERAKHDSKHSVVAVRNRDSSKGSQVWHHGEVNKNIRTRHQIIALGLSHGTIALRIKALVC